VAIAVVLNSVVPLALGGESITGNGTAIAVLSTISIVGGYLLLAGLWYFVFRDKSPKAPEGDGHPPRDRATAESIDTQPPPKRPLPIPRKAGSRFPRR
jgi:hypothetical protein